MNASHVVAGQVPQFVPANPGEKNSYSSRKLCHRNHVAQSGAIGGGVRCVLPARVRGIAHGVVLWAVASKAIADTPAGIDQDSTPYRISTIVWVIIWCAILAIVRRPTKRRGPSIARVNLECAPAFPLSNEANLVL
jgi:hypothetical protein